MSESAQPARSSSVDRADAHSGDLFLLLEQQLEHLVGKHREGRKTIDELRGVIAERERQIARLEQRLADAEEKRARAASRIDGLLEKIDEVEHEVAAAAADASA